jgi:hypothetical protein
MRIDWGIFKNCFVSPLFTVQFFSFLVLRRQNDSSLSHHSPTLSVSVVGFSGSSRIRMSQIVEGEQY